MKIINAVWEMKNLGVKTYEIVVESIEDAENLGIEIEKLDGEYYVVKVSSDIVGAADRIQNFGFKFIEDMIHVEHDLRVVPKNRILQRLYDETGFKKMDENKTCIFI